MKKSTAAVEAAVLFYCLKAKTLYAGPLRVSRSEGAGRELGGNDVSRHYNDRF